jgi:ABC-type ATPase involved in cell division
VGVTVLIATHDISLIAHMGYDILTLEDGSFVRGSGAAS